MKLTVLPSGKIYEFCTPALLRDLISQCLDSPCGAQARCGKCRVRFEQGAPEPVEAEAAILTAQELASGWRLACVTRLSADATVVLPESLALSGIAKDFSVSEPAMFSGRAGIALDIGSTTLAMALADLETGRVIAGETALNPQTRFGADVMSRVFFAMTSPEGNARLHEVLMAKLQSMTDRLCARCGIFPEDIRRMTVVGNPAMLHTFVGEDIASLGRAPYKGLWTDLRKVNPTEVGLPLSPEAQLVILPQIRCNIGADTVAAIVATDMDRRSGVSLLIDLGTNSEIALARNGELYVTSTAAGPAFEGANIRCGMRALPGAVDRVEEDGSGGWRFGTIGDQIAAGLCGSGLVDAVACLLRLGAVTSKGRLLPAKLSPCAAMVEVSPLDGKPQVRFADTRVVLCADDVRQLQLVKGSIRAGMEILLEHSGLHRDDVDRLFLAGSFGQVLNLQNAAAVGLFPAGVTDRVHLSGNAAGSGALSALLDPEGILPRTENVGRTSHYVDCTKHADYEDIFAESMSFEL